MSSSEDGSSDLDMDYVHESSEETDSDIGNRNNRRGPWFTVVDRNTFVIDRLPNLTAESGPTGFEPNSSPLEYFQKFISCDDDNLIERIVDETNLYANDNLAAARNPTPHARGNRWKPVTTEEMNAFFGMVLAMGIVKKPTYASYWDNGYCNPLTDTPSFSQIMSRNRFQAILRFLHCNDNNLAVERGQPGYDPLHKVAPVIDFFNMTFEQNYKLSQNVSVDERIIGFKGRHFLKQYIANKKAHRWGVKAWVLAESSTGYTHHVDIYKGKLNTPRFVHGQGHKVVMDLMRPHFGNQHHVTVDSWFTSPKLVHDLRNRGTFATGTVITSRKGMPQSFKTARLPKGDVLVKSQGPVMAVLYSDRRQVSLLTTCGSAKMVRKANSKGKIVNAPSVVHKYNETMGGVDMGDQLVAAYEPQFRSLNLWKKILFSFLAMATVLDDRTKECRRVKHPGCNEKQIVARECFNMCDILTQNFYKIGETEPYHCCMDFCRCEYRFESDKSDSTTLEANIKDLKPE